MTRVSPTLSPAAASSAPPRPLAALSRWVDIYLELGKARLSALVVATTAVGFLLAADRPMPWAVFLFTLLGTSLAAWSANALNQVIEARLDALMPRTKGRPLPTHRVGAPHATFVATLAGAAGIATLALAVNPLTAALGLTTLLIYVLAYTPLKTRSHLNTLVGAVVGAIPPMMGWAAATGDISAGAWVLAAVLFVWQVPHFLSLAWLCREDYRLGGFRMLTNLDPTGAITSRAILLWTVALLPVTLAATVMGVTGPIYAVGAMLLGGWLTLLAVRLVRGTTRDNARGMFLATVLYLPILMTLMVADRAMTGAAQPIGPIVSVQPASPAPVNGSVQP